MPYANVCREFIYIFILFLRPHSFSSLYLHHDYNSLKIIQIMKNMKVIKLFCLLLFFICEQLDNG